MDEVKGGAGDDTISGIIGSSGTYAGGDNILGGAGTDLLKLIDDDATAAGVVTLEGVEQVNVRMLSAATTQVDASDWNGVATLSNYSSTADSTLSVSGLTIATDISVYDESDVTIEFADVATGSDTATVQLNSVGSGATTAMTFAAAGTATVNIDATAADTIAAVNVEVRGNNFVKLEAGDGLETVTLTGTGQVAFITDDLVATVDASALTGVNRFTFNGVSDVAFAGGAGNDTIVLGTTFSNGDSIDGNGGTDVVSLTMGAFNRSLTAPNVETITATFADSQGATLGLTGAASLTTVSLQGSSSGADGSIAGLADNAVVNLTTASDAFDTVTIDTVSAALALTVNVGTASGGVTLGGIAITDVASVAINVAAGQSGATVALGTATFDADAKSITITNPGDAHLTVDDLHAAGLTTLTINNNGSGDITFTSGIDGSSVALTTINVVANGGTGADVTLASLNGASGSAHAFTTLSLVGSGGSDITVGALILGGGATAAAAGTVTLAANGGGSIVGTTALDITSTGDYDLTLNLSAGAVSTINVGDVTLNAGTAASGASLTVNASVGNSADLLVEEINFANSGGQIIVSPVVVGSSASFKLASGGFSGGNTDNVDIQGINLTVGTASEAVLGAITLTAGAIGSVVLSAAQDAEITLGAIDASAVSTFSVTVGASAGVNVGAISASASIDNISISVTAGATAEFEGLNARAIGDISVSGAAGTVNVTVASATSVGTISTLGFSGTFSADLSGVINAAEIYLGGGTNSIISGLGNDIVYMKTGLGTDTIVFSATGQKVDSIYRFEVGTADDKIAIDDASIVLAMGSSIATAGAGINIVTVSAAATSTIGATTASGIDVIMLQYTAFANVTAVATVLMSGAAATLENAAGASAAGNVLVAWTDGTDSYVTMFEVGIGGSGIGDAVGSAISAAETLAVLMGVDLRVTASALVAANFDII